MYIEVDRIKKSYGEGGAAVQVLNGISTQVDAGEMCVILGPSGSGKSTFLNDGGQRSYKDRRQGHNEIETR